MIEYKIIANINNKLGISTKLMPNLYLIPFANLRQYVLTAT